ncbi:MAG: ChaN family lipoprotein [Pseudohongiella sp.]|nr:ChaN family lipoprotein [Pseudohongiella sp.]
MIIQSLTALRLADTFTQLTTLLKHIATYLCLCLPIAAQAQTGETDQSSQQASRQTSQWLSELHSDHPLNGKIWSSAKQDFLSPDQLISLLAEAGILLLGEKHDNPDHHRLRLIILESLLASDAPVLIVMEMMTQPQQPALDRLAASDPVPAANEWQRWLDWDEAWNWEFYQPALGLALQNRTRTRLVAGNISAETMMAIYRSEAQADQPLSPDQLAILSEEIDASHCGMLPASQIPAMVRVQQARDQQMADSLLETGEFAQRILLAGNYHVRHDLSVPNYLNQHDASTTEPLTVMNLAFLEVDPGLMQAEDYLPAIESGGADTKPAYDLIWFTPAVRADDYCADLSR